MVDFRHFLTLCVTDHICGGSGLYLQFMKLCFMGKPPILAWGVCISITFSELFSLLSLRLGIATYIHTYYTSLHPL